MRNSLINDMKSRLEAGVARAKTLGATSAKISFRHGEETSCNFEGGRLKDTGGSESVGIDVVALVDGHKGATSGNRLEAIDSLVEKAVALARQGSVAHFESYPSPGLPVAVEKHSERTVSLSRERMIEGCQAVTDMLKTYNPDLFVVCSANRSESEGILVTSGGVCHESRKTGWWLSSYVQRTQGTDMLFAGAGRAWCDVNALYDPEVIGERILRDLRRAEKTAKSPTGKVQAFIPSDKLFMFLWPVTMGINGRNVAKGDSPLAGKLGEQVLSQNLTIEDNPHVDYSNGASEIDGDGVPTRKQKLFENGVLQGFLYDLDSAGLAGVEPTGNRGCSPYWPMVTPGEQTAEALLGDIDEGVYVKDLIGYGQSNIINGDFSCNLGLGYRIEKGEIAGRVKDTMISGNIYELFKDNVVLSSDLNYDGRFPAAVIEGLTVSAG